MHQDYSGKMMSSGSVTPLPTKEPRQDEQTKQSLCQLRPLKEMNLNLFKKYTQNHYQKKLKFSLLEEQLVRKAKVD